MSVRVAQRGTLTAPWSTELTDQTITSPLLTVELSWHVTRAQTVITAHPLIKKQSRNMTLSSIADVSFVRVYKMKV